MPPYGNINGGDARRTRPPAAAYSTSITTLPSTRPPSTASCASAMRSSGKRGADRVVESASGHHFGDAVDRAAAILGGQLVDDEQLQPTGCRTASAERGWAVVGGVRAIGDDRAVRRQDAGADQPRGRREIHVDHGIDAAPAGHVAHGARHIFALVVDGRVATAPAARAWAAFSAEPTVADHAGAGPAYRDLRCIVTDCRRGTDGPGRSCRRSRPADAPPDTPSEQECRGRRRRRNRYPTATGQPGRPAARYIRRRCRRDAAIVRSRPRRARRSDRRKRRRRPCRSHRRRRYGG